MAKVTSGLALTPSLASTTPTKSPVVELSHSDLGPRSTSETEASSPEPSESFYADSSVPAITGTDAAVANPRIDASLLNQLVASPTLDPVTRVTLYHDLSQFPQPWLEMMERNDLKVAVLVEGETLAQSPAMAKFAVANVESELLQTKELFTTALSQVSVPDDPELKANLAVQLGENIQAYLLDHKSSCRLALGEKPVDLEALCLHRRVPKDFREAWKSQIRELNANWSQSDPEGRLQGRFNFLILPPIVTAHGPIPDSIYQEAVSTTAKDVEESLGLNRGSDRLVLLHGKYLGENPPELGSYRVAIHEMGHGLDYILEGLPDETGFGSQHKAKVHELFKQAQSKGQFTSDYAQSNVREYFAEAVESYLTMAGPHDHFRSGDNREVLQRVDPEMSRYLERVFSSRPGADWTSQVSPPPQLPPGTPNPDTDPLYLDELL